MNVRVTQKRRHEIQEMGEPAQERGTEKPQENKMIAVYEAQKTTWSDQNRHAKRQACCRPSLRFLLPPYPLCNWGTECLGDNNLVLSLSCYALMKFLLSLLCQDQLRTFISSHRMILLWPIPGSSHSEFRSTNRAVPSLCHISAAHPAPGPHYLASPDALTRGSLMFPRTCSWLCPPTSLEGTPVNSQGRGHPTKTQTLSSSSRLLGTFTSWWQDGLFQGQTLLPN